MEEVTITSIAELIANLASNYKGATWYRGQSVAEWYLKPGIDRYTPKPSETTLLKKFKQSAAMLIDMHPSNSFEWLFLMQHYGVPTRLLDWSESPLTALYFAVSEDKHKNEDGALWALKPTELNKNAKIFGDEDFFIPSFDDTELANYSIDSVSHEKRSKLLPLATIATRNNPRIQAQLGVFTIHHLDDSQIENIGDQSHIKKFIIPKDSKQGILNELKLLGISKFQLFPELSSVGDILKGELV